MKYDWVSKPENAWMKHILPEASKNTKWVEDSKDISSIIPLSKRELYALIILSHACSYQNEEWKVGYDKKDEEPNDGFIFNGKNRLRIEHKLIAQFEPKEVLEAIISTYDKYAKKGIGYGKNRILIIQPNKPSDHGGLIKISELTKSIDIDCPFDQVITLGQVSIEGKSGHIGIIHLIQHYPPSNKIIQINFDYLTGQASVPYSGFELLA